MDSSLPRTKIRALHASLVGREVRICGWVRTARPQKNFAFIQVTDGSNVAGIQVVVEGALKERVAELTTGASVEIRGILAASPGSKQQWEIKASSIAILGLSPPDEYPLQKKQHSPEFLRSIAHLRPRTQTQGAVLRLRSALAFATHLFFQERGFLYVQTPMITGSDCEGGGQQFLVSALDTDRLPRLPEGGIDFSQDFFARKTFLTVSGQLNAEALACALSDVYTFGPTFRAENSNTARHLAEFWMVEPEMAFATLEEDMECAESYLRFLVRYVLKQLPEELQFFDQYVEKGVIDRLQQVASQPFKRLTYTEAINLLQESGRRFDYPPLWGNDLQTEHERYLSEVHCKGPVIVTDYPEKIKAFYMRLNEDGKTVAAMDILVPKIGEIVGGSQREERLDLLERKMRECHLDTEEYRWYLDLRRYGSVPHAGFGAGFERLVLFASGLENIRDAIPFPRFPGNATF